MDIPEHKKEECSKSDGFYAVAVQGTVGAGGTAVLAGQTFTGTVTLTSKAPAGGADVNIAIARLPNRLHLVASAACLGMAVWITPPLDPKAAMVTEAQWERPSSEARRAVTAALVAHWDGTPIMASMGSLGHYMQQMSAQGFAIEDFLHEGNGDIWTAALWGPGRFVKWIMIEETAEGGDALANQARVNPSFLDGFTRTAASGGVALYVRSESGSRE